MERVSRLRSRILMLVFIAIIGFLAYTLYDLQIIETDGNTDNTTTYTTLTRVKASRGDILDTNGNLLVGNRASYDLVLNHYVLLSTEGSPFLINTGSPFSSFTVKRHGYSAASPA